MKDDKRRTNIFKKYENRKDKDIELLVNQLLEIDEDEYKSSSFKTGRFYEPNVQECIQMADYHINNHALVNNLEKLGEQSFYSLEEQLMKLQGLIQQPGLITPDSAERVMQIAYTAKLNSGCISRQVGAVVTDNEFSTKAIGWNDVPKGSIPCSLRNIKELFNIDENLSADEKKQRRFGFTQFELGEGLKEVEQINHSQPDDIDKEIDIESLNFNEYIKKAYTNEIMINIKLGGKNCPYCFKTAYNAFSGEKNQVHTRSLHAEENAMLQISRYGGQGLKDGFLFTTASPCELCAKKAYQLGISTIYFIDPYPGITRSHILKSMKEQGPKMKLFSGAVGRAYHKLYEPFLSQKDELKLLINFELESPQKATNAEAVKAERQRIEEVKTLAIQKALGRGKLTIEEIAEDNSVSTDFVLEVQRELTKNQ